MEDHMNGNLSACVNIDGSAVGMPQLCTETMANQVFWSVVVLVAVYFVLSRIALPRIAGTLANRRVTITSDISAAEDLKRKASDAEAQYLDVLAHAKAEAEKISAETRAILQKKADAAIAKADAEISQQSQESEVRIAGIRQNSSQTAGEVARAVAKELVEALGVDVDVKNINSAVSARMKNT